MQLKKNKNLHRNCINSQAYSDNRGRRRKKKLESLDIAQEDVS